MGWELFMGWVLLQPPGIKTARSVPRTNPSLKEIIALSKINITFYKEQSNSIRQLKYEVFERREIGNQSLKLDLLSKVCWLLSLWKLVSYNA